MELVSVITPAYNASRTLRRAHASLISQLHHHWEHIIVDDGSSDDTPEVIQDLLAEGRVTSARISNRGIGRALNVALTLATGDYVAFLDADDEYHPDHLSAHLAMMHEHPQIDLLWGGVEVIANNYEDTMVPNVEAGTGLTPVANCIVQGTIFGRRHIFLQHRFSEDRSIWWQDYEFVKRVGLQYVVERFPRATYRYYRNSGESMVDRIKVEWAKRATANSGGRDVLGGISGVSASQAESGA